MEPDASADGGPGRDAAHEPNDTNRAGGGLDLKEGELKAAVSVATAQLSQDLLAVGSQVSSIETGHRALMERLHRIAERADKRALHQFGSLQEQVEDARRQILSAREDLEVVRSSFLEQLQLIRDQCESAQQQLHTTEQRFNETEQQLHIAEGRVQATEDKHNSVEQRLRAAEQKNLDGQRKWQQTDVWLQTTRNQLESVELQLQKTVQQLREFQKQFADADTRVKNQLTDADVLIKSLGPDIKSCEQRVERNTAEIAEIQKIVEEHVTRRKYVQVSIDDLTRDVNQFKVHIPKLIGEDKQIKSLHAMFRSNRRMHRFVVAASIVSLLVVVYIGLVKPSWPTIAHYLSLWVPGLKL